MTSLPAPAPAPALVRADDITTRHLIDGLNVASAFASGKADVSVALKDGRHGAVIRRVRFDRFAMVEVTSR